MKQKKEKQNTEEGDIFFDSSANDEFSDELAEEAIKQFREKLKKCQTEKQEYLTGWQRAKADFINLKKEEVTKRDNVKEFCESNLIQEFLALADSFNNLFLHKDKLAEVDKSWRIGIDNIYSQLMSIFKSKGVKEIESIGLMFSPEEHEAIGEIEVDNSEKEGIIIEEVRKGYKLNNKIIRVSQVKVGKYNK